jgi:hypothetical protein
LGSSSSPELPPPKGLSPGASSTGCCHH